jgi:hypothetical protein
MPLSCRPFKKLWAGDTRSIRINIDNTENGESIGDYNLSDAVSFTLAIGVTGRDTYLIKTYAKADVISGPEAVGEIVIKIDGSDTIEIPPGFMSIQVSMLDVAGDEFMIFEMPFEMRANLLHQVNVAESSDVFIVDG